jgi:hypothetical protein
VNSVRRSRRLSAISLRRIASTRPTALSGPLDGAFHAVLHGVSSPFVPTTRAVVPNNVPNNVMRRGLRRSRGGR